MIIQARINDEITFGLVRWNAQEFNATLTLSIQSADLLAVRNAFSTIEKLEILYDGNITATYSNLDTYQNITFVGRQYVEHEHRFTDAMDVVLTKTNIVDQVDRLDKQINPVIDYDSMTLEELKTQILKEIGEACKDDIYAGTQVTLSDGTVKTYSFKETDQINLKTLFDFCAANPDVTALPYHANSQSCEMISRTNIILIYSTLIMRLTEKVTYCNGLNMYVRSLNDRETIKNTRYGDELTGTYLQTYNEIIAQSLTELQKMVHGLIPDVPEDNSEEPEEIEENDGEEPDNEEEPSGE